MSNENQFQYLNVLVLWLKNSQHNNDWILMADSVKLMRF